MSDSQCLAYQRQDNTTHTALIRLPARLWSIIAIKQEELAEELGVPRVSRPVALRHILEEYRHYQLTQNPQEKNQ